VLNRSTHRALLVHTLTATKNITVLAGLRRVEVVVSDNGPGIPVEHRDAVFDPFFTTRQGEGTGLGLSVSFRIIEHHDGDLRLMEGSQGAVFAVGLPAFVPAADAERALS
jgi:signal transduction histidine kinase